MVAGTWFCEHAVNIPINRTKGKKCDIDFTRISDVGIKSFNIISPGINKKINKLLIRKIVVQLKFDK